MNKLAFIVIICFSLIGMFFVNVVGHEVVHYLDFRDLNVNEEGICMLNFPINSEGLTSSAAAYYYAIYNSTEESEYQRLSEGTEFRAYAFSFILYGIYLWTCYFVIKDLYKLKALEKHYGSSS